MICKKCGEEIADDSKFCPICGAKIEAEAEVETPAEAPAEAPIEEAKVETKAEEAPAAETVNPVPTTVDPTEAMKSGGKKVVDTLRKVPAKVWGIAAAAVLAIIVICNIVSCASGKSPYITVKAKDGLAYSSGYDIVTYGGKKISIDGVAKYRANYNNTVWAVMDLDNVLWAVNSKKATKIADDVANFEISLYGDTVVYTVKDGDDYEVYSYDVAKKKSKKIYDEKCTNIVISTNGKYVALRNADGDLLFSKKGATAKKEYSEAVPVGISNDGKMIFYKKNEKFYVNDEKICSTDGLGMIAFNIEGNEVVASSNGSTYYMSSKTKEAVKIKSSGLGGIIVPDNTVRFGSNNVYVYGVKTFNGSMMSLGGSIYYVSKKGESAEKVVNSYSSVKVAADGKSLIYINDGDIYKVANVKKASDPKKIGNDLDARMLYASENLKTIYYMNVDKELRYLKSNGKGELIADDVESISYFGTVYGYSVAYNESLKCVVYINEDDELYTAKTTKKSKQKLAVGDAEGIDMVSNGNAFVAIVSDEDGNTTLYKITSAKKVKKLATVEVEFK